MDTCANLSRIYVTNPTRLLVTTLERTELNDKFYSTVRTHLGIDQNH